MTTADDTWLVSDEPKSIRARSRDQALGLLVVTWLVAVVAIVALDGRIDRHARSRQLMFASVAALGQPDQLGPIIAASEGEALLVGPDDAVERTLTGPHSPSGPAADRWRIRVRNLALAQEVRNHFTTNGPGGEQWWHTTVPAAGGGVLVYAVPESVATTLGRTVVVAIVAMAAAISVAVLLHWYRTTRTVVGPVRLLVEAGDDLVVRGRLRTTVRDAVLDLPERPVEFRRMGEMLDQIAFESQDAARRHDALLAAANALGGSLDPTVVLHKTLEHLGRLLAIERSAILRYDPRTRIFQAIAVRGHDMSYVRDLAASPYDPTTPSVRATREQVPIQVTDTESEVVSSEVMERGRRHGYRSLLAVPLPTDLEHPMVLVLHSSTTRNYSFDEIELCKSFASISGAALRNAELYARVDDRLRQQSSTLSAIVDSVDQGLFVEATDGRVVFTNATMDRLIGSGSSRPATSSDLLDALLVGVDNRAGVRAELADLSPSPAAWLDVELKSPDGPTRSYRVRVFSVLDARGHELGRGQTWTDVSRDRELERMKEGLLAAVSHEFRSPLALIKGYSTTLLADDVAWTAEDQREFLSMVSSEADRLAHLVERLLDMRRIDAGMVSLEVMPTKLARIVDTARLGVPDFDRRVVLDPVPDLTLVCDPARVSTALRNLIDNACRYSPVDEPVTIGFSVTPAEAPIDSDQPGGEIEIVVADRGPGVDPDFRLRIFDTFVRGDGGLRAEHGGVGLGLSIARGFVEAHGGRLTLDETDTGAVFRIRLPVGVADRSVPVRS